MLYAIPDIHGRFDLIAKLYQAIQEDIQKIKDPQGSIIVFLGDYVDRGSNSKEVLDFLMSLQNTDNIEHVFLLGNHEDMMVRGLSGDDAQWHCWLHNGGSKTLKSFGFEVPYSVSTMEKVLQPYIEWLKGLPFYYEKYDYIFCHSGYMRTDFNISLDVQRELLIWGRPSKNCYVGFNKLVVHGHTPTDNVKPYIEINRINLEIAGWWGDYNTLLAARLPHGKATEKDVSFIQIYL